MVKTRKTAAKPQGGPAQAGPPRVYAVYGQDDFLRRGNLDRIANEVLGSDPPPMARIDFDGPSANLADVLDEARTLTFLAKTRLVVVEEADPFITKHRAVLEKYVEAPSSSGVLVLVCKTMNKQWRLSKAIQKIGGLIECKPPPPWERDKWLIGRAKQAYGKRLDAAAARALVELTGDDMASLDSELAKLDLYAADRDTITAADVEALVGLTRPEKVFRMTDALAAGDSATAIKVWRQTLASDKQAAYKAIGGIAWAIRQMILAKQGGQRVSPATSRAASSFSLEQLQDMLVQLLAADVASKTGLGTVETAVEKLIVRRRAGR